MQTMKGKYEGSNSTKIRTGIRNKEHTSADAYADSGRWKASDFRLLPAMQDKRKELLQRKCIQRKEVVAKEGMYIPETGEVHISCDATGFMYDTNAEAKDAAQKRCNMQVFNDVFGAGKLERIPEAAPVGKRKVKKQRVKDNEVAQGQITSQNLNGLSTTWDTIHKHDKVNGDRVRHYLEQKPHNDGGLLLNPEEKNNISLEVHKHEHQVPPSFTLKKAGTEKKMGNDYLAGEVPMEQEYFPVHYHAMARMGKTVDESFNIPAYRDGNGVYNHYISIEQITNNIKAFKNMTDRAGFKKEK